MLYGEEDKKSGLAKGLELLPIAGWLADKSEEVEWDSMEGDVQSSSRNIQDIPAATILEEEEAEALEDLLKEFLSLS